MSTKNLARTVIEGGRHRYNKYERRHSNSIQRTRERQLEHMLCARIDCDALFPRRAPVYRSFSDKLGPPMRWLRAQANRPWDKVRSELFARFDTRTTAGRHILFDHLLAEVEDPHGRFGRTSEYFVDAHGYLRAVRSARPRRHRRAPLPESASSVAGWLAGRRIAYKDGRWLWFEVTRTGCFRQHQPLEAFEVQRWLALPEWFRCELEANWQKLRNEIVS